MGEPGTKEVLRLEDLEASGGIRTGRKHILSILVENRPGVLARIAGLFARRGFNIDSLAVGATDDTSISRITLTVDGATHPIDQVTKQLHKLVNVIKIRDLEPEETVARELALFKISCQDGDARAFTRCYVRHVYGPPFDVHLDDSAYTAEHSWLAPTPEAFAGAIALSRGNAGVGQAC